MQHNLIDGYWLFVNPIILGQGIALFADVKDKTKLNLISTRPFTCGVTELNYIVAAVSYTHLRHCQKYWLFIKIFSDPTYMMTSQTFDADLTMINELVYIKGGLIMSNLKRHTESEAYGACSFELNGLKIEHRTSKTTPRCV